jgi:hypothetical protein
MLRYRRWAAVGALAVAQIGIIVCYVGILRGNAAPAAGAPEKACAPAKDAAADRDGKCTDGTAGPCPAVAGTAVPSEPVMLAQSPPLPQPQLTVPQAGSGEVGPPPLSGPGVVRDIEPVPSKLVQAPSGEAKKDETENKSTAPPLPRTGDVPPPPLPSAPAPSPGASLLKPTDPVAPATPAPPGPAPVIDKADAAPAPPPPAAPDKKEATPATATPIAPPPLPDDKPPAISAPPAVPGTVSGPTSVPAETGNSTTPTPPSGEGRLVPTTTPTAPAEATAPVACPWTLRMEIVKGRTQLEARIGKEVQFRVTCSQLSIEAPRGCLNAKGEVKITGSDLDGSCEGLTINWQDDHVFLEGKAHLKCLRNGQDVELNSERLSVKLSTSSSVKGVGSRKHAQTEEPPAEADDSDLK